MKLSRMTRAAALAAATLPGVVSVQAQEAAPAQPLRLEDLERMATESNPTLKQAEAAIRAAEGRRRQAGLYPNPLVGMAVQEYSFQAPSKTAEYLGFVEQALVLGGRLRQGRRLFEQERLRAEAEAEGQRLAVRGLTHVAYYQALGAQRLVEERSELARIAREAVGTTRELHNVGQADKPDILEIEIEADRAALDLAAARNDHARAWQFLSAVVGRPAMPAARLAGNLDEGTPALEREGALATLLRESPQMRAARAALEGQRAAVDLARAQRIPDLIVRGSVGYNREVLDVLGGPKGWEGALELAVRLPVFDRNQGAVAAARAEADRAEAEVRRLELSLDAQLAGALTEYANAREAAQVYRDKLIPNAQAAYDMYLARFREMTAAYPQVLIAQRTLFQLRAEYVLRLVELWQTAARVQGMLLVGGLNAPGGSERAPGDASPGLSAGARRTEQH